MDAAKTKAQGIIDNNAVGQLQIPTLCPRFLIANANAAVFSKSYCPYCKATKALLSEMRAKFYIIELDQVGQLSSSFSKLPGVATEDCFAIDDGAAIQDALEGMTKQRSVPNIFIQQQHIGGNSDLQAKKSELPDLLKAAGAV